MTMEWKLSFLRSSVGEYLNENYRLESAICVELIETCEKCQNNALSRYILMKHFQFLRLVGGASSFNNRSMIVD